MTKLKRFGGSFAPPLDHDKLEHYEQLCEESGCPEDCAQAMKELITMVREFNKTPRSSQSGSKHPSGRGTIVPLEAEEVERIWDYVPWEDELNLYGQRFDKLKDKELRNAAYHLLWYGRELCKDREPITNDQL